MRSYNWCSGCQPPDVPPPRPFLALESQPEQRWTGAALPPEFWPQRLRWKVRGRGLSPTTKSPMFSMNLSAPVVAKAEADAGAYIVGQAAHHLHGLILDCVAQAVRQQLVVMVHVDLWFVKKDTFVQVVRCHESAQTGLLGEQHPRAEAGQGQGRWSCSTTTLWRLPGSRTMTSSASSMWGERGSALGGARAPRLAVSATRRLCPCAVWEKRDTRSFADCTFGDLSAGLAPACWNPVARVRLCLGAVCAVRAPRLLHRTSTFHLLCPSSPSSHLTCHPPQPSGWVCAVTMVKAFQGKARIW